MPEESDAALSRHQIEAFERDGFLVVPDVFDDEEIQAFGRAVDAAVAARSAGDDRPLEAKSLYEQSFLQCMNLWEDHEDVRAWSFHPRVGAMAAALLHASAVRLWHDQALYKEPGGRVTDPHQDLPFWPIEPAQQVTAWIPFDGSVRERGGMAYLPGSHRVGLQRFVDISHSFQPEPYDILADPKVRDIEARWVEVPPGAVVFHHSLTVHLAAPNETDQMRRVFCLIYFEDGCTCSSTLPTVAVDRQGIEVGAPVEGPVTPIAWPRPPGDLPAPPDTRGPRTGFAPPS